MNQPTDITFEFWTSLRIFGRDHDLYIRFRLDGIEHCLQPDDLNIICGFPRTPFSDHKLYKLKPWSLDFEEHEKYFLTDICDPSTLFDREKAMTITILLFVSSTN